MQPLRNPMTGISAHLLLAALLLMLPTATAATYFAPAAKPAQNRQGARQLFAVRGEVIKKQAHGKGTLRLTIRPPKEFAEVIVIVGENDLVGSATGRAGDLDLLDLLAGEPSSGDSITAAELSEGDVVSIIYDPQRENRALEIYLQQ